MSRAPQIEQQPEQQAQAQAPELNPETAGLPRPLYTQIMQLTPDDAEALSSLLTAYPGFSRAILQVAAGHMGNAAVQRAIATNTRSKTGPGEQPAQHPLSQAELHEFLDDAPAKAPPAKAQPAAHPLSQGELHEFLDDPPAKAQPAHHALSQGELHEFLDDPPAKAPAAETAAAPNAGTAGLKTATRADSPQMAAARAYNHQHSHFADEFNDLTNCECLDQHGGGDDIYDGRKLDPKLVASWQAKHGLQADGMVGPLTVAKAREVVAKHTAAVAAAPQADARPPV
jgi:hypothetical protein